MSGEAAAAEAYRELCESARHLVGVDLGERAPSPLNLLVVFFFFVLFVLRGTSTTSTGGKFA
jgi:hypothetical protein